MSYKTSGSIISTELRAKIFAWGGAGRVIRPQVNTWVSPEILYDIFDIRTSSGNAK